MPVVPFAYDGQYTVHSTEIEVDRENGSFASSIGTETMEVMLTAAGGSTLGDAQYVDLMGQGGSYQDDHRVYGRGGERCLTCGRGWVRRSVTGGRGTHWCPVCQR